jgi:ABC-type antimicrobial peptide transport system permease subunit
MLRSILRVAFRHLTRHKAYTILNITGLAVGMAGALLIGLWIWDEVSFDRYHENYDRIAQVMVTRTNNGVKATDGNLSVPLAEALREEGDITRVAVVFPPFVHTVAVGEKRLSGTGVWAQPELPEMLTIKMLEGRRDALKDPSTVLLDRSMARALFGDRDPMNQTIRVDNMTEVRVGGVFEDLPRNTTFHGVSLLLPWDRCVHLLPGMQDAQTSWDTWFFQIYVETKPGADLERLNARIEKIIQPHIQAGKPTLLLQPMKRWRLYSTFENGRSVGGRIGTVRLFLLVGVFVLLLACINFMNLSTARSEKRAREVGIRKVVGGLRIQLVAQFLGESVLVAMLGLVLAVVIARLGLPWFNGLTDKDMALPWGSPGGWALVVGATWVTGLAAGSYPALYLSGFEPIRVLKRRKTGLPRKVLVVIQFTVSVALILGTLAVYRQVRFAKDRPVGYTRAGLLRVTMNTSDIYGASYNALRTALIASGAVADMAESSIPSTTAPALQSDISWEGKAPGYVPQVGVVGVTHDYGHTLGWQVLDGRDFSRDFPADTNGIVLNESAVRLMGLKSPIGKVIRVQGKQMTILGVVGNMVMGSPYEPVQATIFCLGYSWINDMVARVRPDLSLKEALARMTPVFAKFNPAAPFEFHFTDEEYAQKFADEERTAHIATVFALFAVFISCLGLFGLASFMAEQRTRELGVRKVLGASVFRLWLLLSGDFALLVALACVIAVPLSAYGLHRWLLRYAYHATLSWWVFAVPCGSALLLTLLTVSYQSLRAALVNPAQSLKADA